MNAPSDQPDESTTNHRFFLNTIKQRINEKFAATAPLRQHIVGVVLGPASSAKRSTQIYAIVGLALVQLLFLLTGWRSLVLLVYNLVRLVFAVFCLVSMFTLLSLFKGKWFADSRVPLIVASCFVSEFALQFLAYHTALSKFGANNNSNNNNNDSFDDFNIKTDFILENIVYAVCVALTCALINFYFHNNNNNNNNNNSNVDEGQIGTKRFKITENLLVMATVSLTRFYGTINFSYLIPASTYGYFTYLCMLGGIMYAKYIESLLDAERLQHASSQASVTTTNNMTSSNSSGGGGGSKLSTSVELSRSISSLRRERTKTRESFVARHLSYAISNSCDSAVSATIMPPPNADTNISSSSSSSSLKHRRKSNILSSQARSAAAAAARTTSPTAIDMKRRISLPIIPLKIDEVVKSNSSCALAGIVCSLTGFLFKYVSPSSSSSFCFSSPSSPNMQNKEPVASRAGVSDEADEATTTTTTTTMPSRAWRRDGERGDEDTKIARVQDLFALIKRNKCRGDGDDSSSSKRSSQSTTRASDDGMEDEFGRRPTLESQEADNDDDDEEDDDDDDDYADYANENLNDTNTSALKCFKKNAPLSTTTSASGWPTVEPQASSMRNRSFKWKEPTASTASNTSTPATTETTTAAATAAASVVSEASADTAFTAQLSHMVDELAKPCTHHQESVSTTSGKKKKISVGVSDVLSLACNEHQAGGGTRGVRTSSTFSSSSLSSSSRSSSLNSSKTYPVCKTSDYESAESPNNSDYNSDTDKFLIKVNSPHHHAL